MKHDIRFLFLPAVAAVALMVVGLAADRRAGAAEKEGTAGGLFAEAKGEFAKLPETMPGSEQDTRAKIRLGRKLYFETAISINKTQSCNSCHRLDERRAGVDNLPTSKGAEGQFGGRNAPTTLNAGLHIAQFWDGRAPDLAAQAKGPVMNPIEMGMPNEAAVLERLKEAGYEALFKQVFPEAAEPLTYDNYAEAVAAFERTLITRDRFDDFLGGDENALSKTEQRGLALFLEIGCADCHSGALLGGDRYEKMGQANEYANKEDLGRFEVTKKEEDKYVFKVPSLRNIALTGPYFHDGKVAKLCDAVKQMAWLQLGEELDDEQVQLVVAFLGTLSDKKLAAGPAAKEKRKAAKKPAVKKKVAKKAKE
jgi:cytochrome c peroxidase